MKFTSESERLLIFNGNMRNGTLVKHNVLFENIDNEGAHVGQSRIAIEKEFDGEYEVWFSYWTGENDFVNQVVPGKYKIVETETPKGYKALKPIEFEITKDGKIMLAGKEVKKLTVVHEKEGNKANFKVCEDQSISKQLTLPAGIVINSR